MLNLKQFSSREQLLQLFVDTIDERTRRMLVIFIICLLFLFYFYAIIVHPRQKEIFCSTLHFSISPFEGIVVSGYWRVLVTSLRLASTLLCYTRYIWVRYASFHHTKHKHNLFSLVTFGLFLFFSSRTFQCISRPGVRKSALLIHFMDNLQNLGFKGLNQVPEILKAHIGPYRGQREVFTKSMRPLKRVKTSFKDVKH